MTWVITKREGATQTERWEVPAELDQHDIKEVLRRLVSRDISEEDIIHSSLPLTSSKRYALLDIPDDPDVMRLGTNPFYTATRE